MRVIHFATTSVMHKAFVLPLARHQRDWGLEVAFGCGEDLPEGYASAVPELKAAGFQVFVVPFPYAIRPWRDLVAMLRLWRFFRRERFDVVHTYTSKAGILVRTAARLAGRAVIVHTAYDFHFRRFAAGWRRTLFAWIERLAARHTDVLLCSADVIRDEAVRERIAAADRITVVGGPVGDLERFVVAESEVGALRTELGLAPGVPVVACVCRLVDYKGVDTLLRAARLVIDRLPQVWFVVMGGGPLEAELRRQAAQLGVADHVVFAGFRSDDRDVLRLLALATVFCLPTRREGYGVAFVEAMAMGCPPIGPRIEPVSRLVLDGATGLLVAPEDVTAYAAAVIRLLEDSTLRGQLADAGRVHVLKAFDPKSMYAAITALYEASSRAA